MGKELLYIIACLNSTYCNYRYSTNLGFTCILFFTNCWLITKWCIERLIVLVSFYLICSKYNWNLWTSRVIYTRGGNMFLEFYKFIELCCSRNIQSPHKEGLFSFESQSLCKFQFNFKISFQTLTLNSWNYERNPEKVPGLWIFQA